MASTFTREHLKICIAKMCLTIGWHNTMTTPMELLTDILYNYLYYLGKTTTDYAHQFGMTEANLEHLSLTFKDFRVNLKDFIEYVNSVECPSKINVPKYPVPKQNHLNFLKPGSKEVVSRQVHVHEHLPPMFPLLENNVEEQSSVENTDLETKTSVISPEGDFKKRPRIIIGHAVRELSSVMMTTSGFLSPAREGKLPEARTPDIALEPSVSPTEPFKKPAKMKKFFKMRREFFKQFNDHESLKKAMKIKKRKLKFRNMMAAKNYMIVSNTNKPPPSETQVKPVQNETPVTKNIPPLQPFLGTGMLKEEPYVEKLSSKPCKRKINILRRISKKNKPVKVEKLEEPKSNIVDNLFSSIPSSAAILNNFPNDLTVKPIKPVESAESNRKRKFNILRKPLSKTRKNDDILFKLEEPPRSNTDSYLNIGNDTTVKYHASHDLNIEPVNMMLPTGVINKRKANILRKISSKPKSSKVSNKEFKKHYSTEFTANIMKDVGLHHNICKDLIIEPISSMPSVEKPVKLESYYSNIPRIDTTITPKIDISTTALTSIKPDPLREPMLRSPKQFSTPRFDFEMNRPKIPGVPINLPPPTITPMHFPFFNPFVGPGLIPSPLMNPLFPHLPIPPLGLPTFGQLPMPVPSVPSKPPLNIRSSIEQPPVTKPQTLSKAPQTISKAPPVEIVQDNAVLELEDNILDLKQKKKKKKKSKMKHKSEKRKKEKSESKKLKKESKLIRDRSPMQLQHSEYEITQEVPNIPTLHIKPKTELLSVEQTTVYKREVSPELAKFSALITGQPKQKNGSTSRQQDNFSHNVVKRGRGRPRIHPVTHHKKEIWTCPVCGSEDNGNPMICCDGCNTWYHWVCVGIQIPPEASEDWYCRNCINNKVEHLESDSSSKLKVKEKW